MSAYEEDLANEQRLLAEQARQKKIQDDATAQAILNSQLQQQAKNLQAQLQRQDKNLQAQLQQQDKNLQAQLQRQDKNLQGQVNKLTDKISALEFGKLSEGCASLATLNKEVAKKFSQPEIWAECTALCKKVGELEYCEFYQ